MKATVDKDTCIACGLCPSICPECFEIEDDGKAGLLLMKHQVDLKMRLKKQQKAVQ